MSASASASCETTAARTALTSAEVTEALRASCRTTNRLVQELSETINKVVLTRASAQVMEGKSIFAMDVWATFAALDPDKKRTSFKARSMTHLTVTEAQEALTAIPGQKDRAWTIVSIDRTPGDVFIYIIFV